MDVMMVNGTVYPFLNVEPKAYRFRILNASNDRFSTCSSTWMPRAAAPALLLRQ